MSIPSLHNQYSYQPRSISIIVITYITYLYNYAAIAWSHAPRQRGTHAHAWHNNPLQRPVIPQPPPLQIHHHPLHCHHQRSQLYVHIQTIWGLSITTTTPTITIFTSAINNTNFSIRGWLTYHILAISNNLQAEPTTIIQPPTSSDNYHNNLFQIVNIIWNLPLLSPTLLLPPHIFHTTKEGGWRCYDYHNHLL